MARAPAPVPVPDGTPVLADGGLETTLIFHEGLPLPCNAAFPLVATEVGRGHLTRYFTPFLRLAAEHAVGFVLDTATWRANADWGAQLGYSRAELAALNLAAVRFAQGLREAAAAPGVAVNGVFGPRGDGYRIDTMMTAAEAEAYHAFQADLFREAGADMVTAVTMTYAEEAIGITRAARAVGLPVAVSFTVETDGRLPSGQSLRDAIAQVDAATAGAPAFFMINCAHPTHFADALADGGGWTDRIGGIRANASRKSHAELDESPEIDIGDPVELAGQYRDLRGRLRRLSVLGGCCGTDHRHVAAICEACL